MLSVSKILSAPPHCSDPPSEEICFSDHRVSPLLQCRDDGCILTHPELLGEGQPEDGIVLILVGRFWVWALWGQVVFGACIWALGWSPCFSKATPENPHLDPGRNHGSPLLRAPHQWIGPAEPQAPSWEPVYLGSILTQAVNAQGRRASD